jgi:hypothetical protein
MTPDTSGEINLQAGGATIATIDSSGITMASGKGLAATGHVLQVVNASYSTTTGSSSSTYADTGLTASITPSSTSSKILVIVHQEGLSKVTNSTGVDLKLFRGATELALFGGNAGQQYTTAWNFVGGAGITYLDSPSTTSSTTYKTQFSSTGNNANVYVQSNNATSTITLMEIAG